MQDTKLEGVAGDYDILSAKSQRETWQRVGHRIQRCDATTGHTVRDVALCDTAETAKRIIEGLRATWR